MNLNKHKFIIHSGCSYGRLGLSAFQQTELISNFGYQRVKQKLKDINRYDKCDNVILINVPMSSHGSDWQSDSTIYTINKLLELGVDSSNIYSMVEWSQWDRTSQPLPQFLESDKLVDGIKAIPIQWGEHSDIFILDLDLTDDKDILHYISENLNIKASDSANSGLDVNLGIIEDNFYLSPRHSDESNIKNPYIKHWIEESKKIEDSEYIDSILRRYLNNIIRTQNFLKLKGIKYNFFHMQGCLTNWFSDDGITKHMITHSVHLYSPYIRDDSDNIILNKKYNPINNPNSDFEKMWPKFNWLFKQIDLDKFWFYENEKYRRGGIDEWAIDTFKECGYAPINSDNPNDVMIDLPNYGYHPIEFLYHLKWNDICSECDFLKFSNEYIEKCYSLIEEDYNSNNATENGIIISKKFYEDRTKKM